METSEEIHITASFGVTVSKPDSEESVDAIIRRADALMIRAKKEGRGRICTTETNEEIEPGTDTEPEPEPDTETEQKIIKPEE